MIKLSGVAVMLLVAAILVACGADLPKDTIAKVGLTTITQDDFDRLESAYEAAGRAPDKGLKKEYARFEKALAEHLVTMEILEQKAASLKVTVTDQDVQQEIAKFRSMFLGNEQRFQKALEERGLTLESLTESIRENLLLERMKVAVSAGVTVTDQEAEAYYQSHRSEYVHAEQRQVRHILVSPFASVEEEGATASQSDWEAAEAEARKLLAQIRNGSDFASQAKQYSDDADTSANGGKLGTIVRGQMTPAFEEAVFSLKKDELSEPVKTHLGYHLIQVTGITPEEQIEYPQAAEDIKRALLASKQEQAWRDWLADQAEALGVEYREDLKPEKSSERPRETTSTTVDNEAVEPDTNDDGE